ncbi:MAG: LamG-like jellyroll fold domain-containing protein [Bacteroidota bacterium]|nr:LamG-like jellyroll fold domain-containing protein [Bacteroidota bacterium]
MLPLYFGCSSPGGDYFKGKIDEISIYNRALTAGEISLMYSSAAPVESLNKPDSRMEIYPNPFSNEITILNHSNKAIQAAVFDLMGSKIFEQIIEPDNAKLDLTIINGTGVFLLQLNHFFYKIIKL